MSSDVGWRMGFARVLEAMQALLGIPTGVLTGGYGGQVSLVSDEFDMTVVADTPFGGNWTGLAGFKWTNPTAVRILFTNIAATTFSVGPTLSMGNNGAFNNMLSSAVQPSGALIQLYNALGAGGTYPGGSIAGTLTTNKLPDLAVPPHIRITSGATGTAITQAKARIVIVTGFAPTSVLPTH